MLRSPGSVLAFSLPITSISQHYVFSILTHARPHLCWRVIHCPRPPLSAHCPLVTAFLQLMTRALHPGLLASHRILCISPSGINIPGLYVLRICCASQGIVLIGSLNCSSSDSKKLLFNTERLSIFITITVKDIILPVKYEKYQQWFLNHIFIYLKIIQVTLTPETPISPLISLTRLGSWHEQSAFHLRVNKLHKSQNWQSVAPRTLGKVSREHKSFSKKFKIRLFSVSSFQPLFQKMFCFLYSAS